MSDVRIDESALAAEAAAVAQESGVEPAATAAGAPPGGPVDVPGTGPNQDQVRQGYRMISLALIDRGGSVLAPAWRILPEKKSNLADAIAEAAMLWFGDMPIPPKYLALLIVADAVIQIADDNRDPQTGQLKPLRVPPKAAEPARAA